MIRLSEDHPVGFSASHCRGIADGVDAETIGDRHIGAQIRGQSLSRLIHVGVILILIGRAAYSLDEVAQKKEVRAD